MSSLLPSLLRIMGVVLGLYVLLGGVVFFAQRSLLYHPTQRAVESVMQPWMVDGQYWGMVREVPTPTAVWLVLHGNGGQAAHRDYLLNQVAEDAAVFVLEYPGYGGRPGMTTAENVNEAAGNAWRQLRGVFPNAPMGVIGESIGSGPAVWLAGQGSPPDKTVLLVPFDQLHRVAADRFWWLPVKWLMRDNWDNIAALSGYAGQLEIYAARDDEIIPVERAEALAHAYPHARFELMDGGHNSWEWEERFDLKFGPEKTSDSRN